VPNFQKKNAIQPIVFFKLNYLIAETSVDNSSIFHHLLKVSGFCNADAYGSSKVNSTLSFIGNKSLLRNLQAVLISFIAEGTKPLYIQKTVPFQEP
jgi:hypothetical protein